jgi:hypothetical protein
LGEEIAAIGDLDGKGLSEILAGSPNGGHALVVSFGKVVDLPPLSSHRRVEQVILSWPESREGWRLEQSSDLQSWTPLSHGVGSPSLEIEIWGKPKAFFRWIPSQP